MYCLRNFDMAAAYRAPSLFHLYAETPYSIAQGLSVEEHVKMHLKNSNYGHRGGNPVIATMYEWNDLTDELVQDKRFEHDMLHAFLAVVAEDEGWEAFFADGNHRAEVLIVNIEPIFMFWEQSNVRITALTDQSVYSHKCAVHYERLESRDFKTFKAGWVAASNSERPMTAFEARFLGVPPKASLQDIRPNHGELNKWGEPFVDRFSFDTERARVFFERMEPVRARMLDTLKNCTLYDHKDQDVCQAFFKSLRMDEIAAVIRGQDDGKPLSFDNESVRAAHMRDNNPYAKPAVMR